MVARDLIWVQPGALNCGAHRIRGAAQAVELLVRERYRQYALDPEAADDRRQAQAYAIDSVLTVDQRRNGEHRRFVAHDRFDDPGERRSDRKVGGPLAADDLVGGIAHAQCDRVHVLPRARHADQFAVPMKLNVGETRARPCNELAVSMLAEDVGVDVARIDAVVRRQFRPQPHRIEDRAGAEYSRRRKSRELQGAESQCIDWIGRDQKQALRVNPHELGDDGAQDLDIAANERRTALALPLRCARRDDRYGSARGIDQFTCSHAHGSIERRGVRDVHDLALGTAALSIDKDNLPRES